MSFSSLLINRCSWKRRVNVGINSYGDLLYSEITIGDNVPCSRQVAPGKNDRDTERIQLSKFNLKNVKFFMEPTDIEEGDIVLMIGSDYSDFREVLDVRDAAGRGHHLEIYVREITPQGEGDKFHG